jgi:hypothetical protein
LEDANFFKNLVETSPVASYVQFVRNLPWLKVDTNASTTMDDPSPPKQRVTSAKQQHASLAMKPLVGVDERSSGPWVHRMMALFLLTVILVSGDLLGRVLPEFSARSGRQTLATVLVEASFPRQNVPTFLRTQLATVHPYTVVRGRRLTTAGGGSRLDPSAVYRSYQALRRECQDLLSPPSRESKHARSMKKRQREKRRQRSGHTATPHPRSGSTRGWKVLHSANDIEVSIKPHPVDASCPYVKMKARIPVPVSAVWDYLRIENWDRSMKTMDPYYDGHLIQQDMLHHGARMTLCRKQSTKLVGGLFGKRDFTFVSIADTPSKLDGTLVGATLSVDVPSIFPRRSGYTRAYQDSISWYKPVIDPVSGKPATDLTILVRLDLNDSVPPASAPGTYGNSTVSGGHMPMWLYVQTVGTTAAMSMSKLRQALIRSQRA